MSHRTIPSSSQWFTHFSDSSSSNTNNQVSTMFGSSTTSSEPNSNTNTKVYVEHNYQDHYRAPIYRPHEDGNNKRRGPRGGVLVPFPEKLYQMLNQISKDGLDDVVSWQPHGRCFVVHQPERFVEEVMPRYFSQTKLTSFQRQVNLYGFRRLTAGSDRNGYYHEMFLRGRPDLLKRMTRVRVKGIGCKLAPSPATEPNFYRMPYCYENNGSTAGGAFQEDLITSQVVSGSRSIQEGARASPNSSIVSIGMASAQAAASKKSNAGSNSKRPITGENANDAMFSTYLEKLVQQRTDAASSSSLPMPDLMGSLAFTDTTSSAAVGSVDPLDLNPLPTNSSSNYLFEMQDDIISLLAAGNSALQQHQEPTSTFASLTRGDSHNILSDLGSNFWEI